MKLVYINSSFVVDFIRYVRAENKKSNYFDLDEKNRDMIGKLDRILGKLEKRFSSYKEYLCWDEVLYSIRKTNFITLKLGV